MNPQSKQGKNQVNVSSSGSGTSGVHENPLVDRLLKQASFERHNYLGESGIKVSKICLGTMTFGNIDKTFGERPGQLSEHEAHRLLDRFVELGGNFIDTAVFYPFFGNTAGESETIIGNWLVKQDRKKIVILTRIGLPTDFRDINCVGLSRVNLINALENSLKRLRTDFVDVLSIACWDDVTNIGDMMRTLNDFVRTNRVRHIGCSDIKGWQLQACLDHARLFNLEKFMSFSCEYNLLNRGADLEIIDILRSRRVSLLPYSPLKGGYLTDKIKPGMTKLPENTRIAAASKDPHNIAALALPFDEMKKNELYNRVLNTLQLIAKKHNKTAAQVALRYLLHKDFVCSVIVGVKSISQLEENMGSLNFELNIEDLNELDRVSLQPLPSPYNIDALVKLTRSTSLTRSADWRNIWFQNQISAPSLIGLPLNFPLNIIETPFGHSRHSSDSPQRTFEESQFRNEEGRFAHDVQHGASENVNRNLAKSGGNVREEREQQPVKGQENVSKSGGSKPNADTSSSSSTLGNIVHSIGSSITGAMSGGGLSTPQSSSTSSTKAHEKRGSGNRD